MGKFKEMDLLRQEREAFDADYPMEPTPRADMWIAWNSEDGFTYWDNEQQATLWSADKSIEWPVQYVMQKVKPAPVQPVAWMHEWEDGERVPMLRKRDVDSSDIDSPISVRPLVFGDTTPPAAQPAVPLTDEQTTDKDRLDWLNNNFFHRENIDWLTGNVSKESLMWVFFAPTNVQGDIRRVIDSAIEREGITKGCERG